MTAADTPGGHPLRPPGAEAFAGRYPFPLDPFQRDGIAALIAGRATLVAAPTGAGKTVVGEFAVWYALERGGKCFYTTPIKALSNQKYADLVAVHGGAQVGLLTGDRSVNGEAPVVVMTTEVLRNMLYEGSPTLRGLSFVVLDEVHYLADRERGAVWEEVIVQLSESVQLACLSATVSNAEEFGDWLAEVRSGCDVVISEHRPVPLEHHYAISTPALSIYPVFSAGRGQGGRKPDAADVIAARQAKAGRPNPEILMLERQAAQTARVSRRGRAQHTGPRLRPPRRSQVVVELDRRDWLPAIYFLFSRQGCEDAVQQLIRDGLRLTTAEEQEAIRAVVDARTADLPGADLDVLGYGPWAAALELGIAAHHAGLVPVFKETVEDLFVRGLLKVCFATETLALGINMPARTVVIERLEKWDGQRHELLTPGQFTQLTGRAGRRGLDPVGHAVVLYQRDVDFAAVAGLVGRRTEPLVSRFAPSYNMAVNLLRSRSLREAETLLEQSFASFQADRAAGGASEAIARNRAAIEGYEEQLYSDRGDFAAYWALRRELSRLESAGAAARKARRVAAVEGGIASLRPGDVIALPSSRRRPRLGAVVSQSTSKAGTPLLVVATEDRTVERLGPRELDEAPRPLGWIPLPGGHHRQPAYRRAVADALHRVDPRVSQRSDAAEWESDEETAARIVQLRDAIRAHPVHGDPGLAEIEVWAHRADDLRRSTDQRERDLRKRTGIVVRRFDRTVGLLTELGYLADERPTAHGLRLAGIYAETDLVLAECLRHGVFNALDAAELACVVSAFTYETRAAGGPPMVRLPTAATRDAFEEAEGIAARIVAEEERAKLPPTRPLDPGAALIVWRWARGATLDGALGEAELLPGDFVRSCKQVADLLRQLRDAAPEPVRSRAGAAAATLVRGVVAYVSG